MAVAHSTRKHSKFSASGAARWFACPGSVALSEGIPSRDTRYSIEGTLAHEVLEVTMQNTLKHGASAPLKTTFDASGVTKEMVGHAKQTASHILNIYTPIKKHSDILIEKRVTLDFIHPEAFGSLDYAIAEHFGTLHILDYKFGKKLVSPVENLQFIFYALGVAHQYDFNFKSVRMWTLQPRARGFDGCFSFWDLPILKLKDYIKVFRRAVMRVEKSPGEYHAGEHCFFCPAQKVCPLKQDAKLEKARAAFSSL